MKSFKKFVATLMSIVMVAAPFVGCTTDSNTITDDAQATAQVGAQSGDNSQIETEYTSDGRKVSDSTELTYKNFFPANKQWIEECGENFSTDNETILYCGEYIMTTYEPSSIIVSELNPTYWDMEDMHITKITEIYNSEAGTVEPEMYLRGEISGCNVPTEQLEEWLNDPEKYEKIRPCRPSYWTYFYYFNFYPNFDEKYEPDNWKLAVNKVNFHKSITEFT